MFKRNKKIALGSVITLIIVLLTLMFGSMILNGFQTEGTVTSIVGSELQGNIVAVRNIFSKEGIKFFFGDAIKSFKNFEPLALLVISLMVTGILEASGLIKAFFAPIKRFKIEVIIFFTLLAGMLFSFAGELAFVALLPIAAAVYKEIGRNPIIGAITMFIAVGLGHGISFIGSYDIAAITNLTTLSANVSVDADFEFVKQGALFLKIVTSILFAFLGTAITRNYIAMKIPEFKYEDDKKISKKGLLVSNIMFGVLALFVIYMIIPNMPFSGILLDNSKTSYIEKLFGPDSPFKEGILYIALIITSICSFVYGKISKNIKTTSDFTKGLSKNFSKMGTVFVLFFLVAQIFAILNWTNLGVVLPSLMISFLTSLKVSGILLVLTFFILVILMSFFIPATVAKWNLMAPMTIPLFMRANITPEYIQYIYIMADGVGKSLSPIFPYFILLMGLVNKYNQDDNYKVTVFGTYKLILPAILMILLLWLLIAIGWYIVGLPIGIGIYPTI